MTPYYADDAIALYHGDCREILPQLGAGTSQAIADACIADPPYSQTALAWDTWPSGWPAVVSDALPSTTSMWCFGSLRMFLDRASDFAAWRIAEDIVWQKPNGSGPRRDVQRFLRVHESVVRFWRGPYDDLQVTPPVERVYTTDKSARRRAGATPHLRTDRGSAYVDDGTRVARSIRPYPAIRGRGRNETEKPIGLVAELLASIVPVGGTVLDPTAGSGTTGDAARQTGRRAVLIEVREEQCEIAARRFDAGVLGGVG